jgi:hypothetical protein
MTVSSDRVEARYAGIDVSKDHLEVAVCDGDGTLAGAPRRLPNTAAGLLARRPAVTPDSSRESQEPRTGSSSGAGARTVARFPALPDAVSAPP